jgi:hypothetical protein
MLEQHYVAEEWLYSGLERFLLVRPPEIVRIPDGFLDPVIEVVTIGRACLRFHFNAGDEVAIRDGKQIPPLAGAEIAGQVGINLTGKYLRFSDSA